MLAEADRAMDVAPWVKDLGGRSGVALLYAVRNIEVVTG